MSSELFTRTWNYKKEIIASISIICIMIIIAIPIHEKIMDNHQDTVQKYSNALRITDSSMFQYGMDTNVGGAFVYGDLKAVDPVTFKHVNGKYIYIEYTKEKYTKHEETFITVDSDGNEYTETETYWSWDRDEENEKSCTEVTFLGIAFKRSQFSLGDNLSTYISTYYETNDIRFIYYGIPEKITGTIYTELHSDGINDKPSFQKKTIDEYYVSLTSNYLNYIFWFLWIILTGFLVVGFISLEKSWLNKD